MKVDLPDPTKTSTSNPISAKVAVKWQDRQEDFRGQTVAQIRHRKNFFASLSISAMRLSYSYHRPYRCVCVCATCWDPLRSLVESPRPGLPSEKKLSVWKSKSHLHTQIQCLHTVLLCTYDQHATVLNCAYSHVMTMATAGSKSAVTRATGQESAVNSSRPEIGSCVVRFLAQLNLTLLIYFSKKTLLKSVLLQVVNTCRLDLLLFSVMCLHVGVHGLVFKYRSSFHVCCG